MRNIGKIKIGLLLSKYSVSFDYATPRKIDLFALVLMEIIDKHNNFPEQTIQDVLLEMEIPKDLHNIFEDRLNELIKSTSPFISREDLSREGKTINDLVKSFSLTERGREAYFSMEIAEDPKKSTQEYAYNQMSAELNRLSEIVVQPENEAVVLNFQATQTIEELNKVFAEIIRKDLKRYVFGANNKTVVFNLSASPTGNIYERENIEVSIDDNGQLMYSNKNSSIKEMFIKNNLKEKSAIRKKMFSYLDVTKNKVDYSKVQISTKKDIPLKVAFGEVQAISNYSKSVEFIATPDEGGMLLLPVSTIKDFNFAGIKEDNKTIVYKYSEVTSEGYTIPLESLDYSEAAYDSAYIAAMNFAISEIKAGRNREENIKFALLIAPAAKKISTVRNIIGAESKDFYKQLDLAKEVVKVVNKNPNQVEIVNEYVLELIRNAHAQKKINVDEILSLREGFQLPNNKLFKIIADNNDRSDRTINTLLAVDEGTTLNVFDLVSLYNKLLEKNEIKTISHRNNIFSSYLDYDRQLEKLKAMGFKTFYDYEFPKSAESFMKEVDLLKKYCEKLKPFLQSGVSREANDFFAKTEDLYYDTIPEHIDTASILTQEDQWEKDIDQAINSAKPNFLAIAAVIRGKFAEHFRAIEKEKDKEAKGERKGKELIRFTLSPKMVDETYAHWRNLNKLVHPEINEEDDLTKGTDKERRRALSAALNCYTQKLSPPKKREEKK